MMSSKTLSTTAFLRAFPIQMTELAFHADTSGCPNCSNLQRDTTQPSLPSIATAHLAYLKSRNVKPSNQTYRIPER